MERVGDDEVRVGTAERETVVRLLGDHFAAGRLKVEEYEERAHQGVEATTRGDLRPLFADLPAPYPPFLAAPVPEGPPSVYHRAGSEPVVYSDRSRLAAGVLQILLPFGIGRFYTGHTGTALAQLVSALFFVGIVWSFVDGVLLIAKGGEDRYGRPLRD